MVVNLPVGVYIVTDEYDNNVWVTFDGHSKAPGSEGPLFVLYSGAPGYQGATPGAFNIRRIERVL